MLTLVSLSLNVLQFFVTLYLLYSYVTNQQGGGGNNKQQQQVRKLEGIQPNNDIVNENIFGQRIDWVGGHPQEDKFGNCWCKVPSGNDDEVTSVLTPANQRIRRNNYINNDGENLILSSSSSLSLCNCTPSVAIDVVIESYDQQHVWLVRRKDTDLLATLGGFVEVGENVEQTVVREIMEEMNVNLYQVYNDKDKNDSNNNNNSNNNEDVDSGRIEQRQGQQQHHHHHHGEEPKGYSFLTLLGIYSDPRRDNRRPTTSAVFKVTMPKDQIPVAGDDAKQVMEIPVQDIDKYSYFADHKTILLDYYNQYHLMKKKQTEVTVGDFALDIARSTCQK